MAAIGGILVLAGFALFVLALIAMFKPLPKLRMGTRKAAAIGMALSAGSCIVGGAITPTYDADPAAPVQVAEAEADTPAEPAAPAPPAELPTLASRVRSIEEVQVAEPQINIRVFTKSAWDDVAYVDAGAAAVAEIARALQKGVREDGEGIQSVFIRFYVAGSDRLGNDTHLEFFGVRFAAADLRAAKTENLSGARMLNLATDAWFESPAGAQAVAAWCEKNLSDGEGFCRKVLL